MTRRTVSLFGCVTNFKIFIISGVPLAPPEDMLVDFVDDNAIAVEPTQDKDETDDSSIVSVEKEV